MKRRALTPSEIAAFSPGLSNPDFKIAGCRAGAEETGNPFYIWLAAEICIATKREFPGWVLDYLKQCAVRMRSPEARKHSDLRKMLPWVLGFPSKGKRGPGNPLDPDLGRPHLHFVLQFSAYIYCGVDPTTALHEACNDVFEDDDINDATLQRWVKKHYGLKTWPRTFDEWREVILRQYPRERLARWFGMAAQGYGIGRDKNPFRKALKLKR